MQRTGSILIIDTDSAIVAFLVEILTDEGYIAYPAPHGAGALVAIARHPPALILLDTGCSDRHSAAEIEQVCAVGSATCPVVLMTTAPRGAAALFAPTAVECLAKPFDLDGLLACVARYVQPLAIEPASLALGCPALASI